MIAYLVLISDDGDDDGDDDDDYNVINWNKKICSLFLFGRLFHRVATHISTTCLWYDWQRFGLGSLGSSKYWMAVPCIDVIAWCFHCCEYDSSRRWIWHLPVSPRPGMYQNTRPNSSRNVLHTQSSLQPEVYLQLMFWRWSVPSFLGSA